MNKVKKIMVACVSLLFSAVSLFSFSACNQPPDQEEKVKFSWDMSALTVAIERSYTKATGGKSESVLDGDVLNDIIPSVDYEEIKFSLPFMRSYLYSIEIESISEFYVAGSHDDVISEYCGSGPYRILVAEYTQTIHQLYVSHSSDYGFRERYFTYNGDKSQYIAVEGANRQLLFCGRNSWSYIDNVEISNFALFNYMVGLESKSIPYRDMKKDLASYEIPRSHIEIIYDRDWSFAYVYNDGTASNESGYRNEYTVRQESFKTYEMHDEYLVTDLVVPAWYNKEEYEYPEA